MKMLEALFEKFLRTVSLPEGQEFKCQVCGGKGRHYREVLMSDGTVIRVGPRCLKKLKGDKDISTCNSGKKVEAEGVVAEPKTSCQKTLNVVLKPGEALSIRIEVAK